MSKEARLTVNDRVDALVLIDRILESFDSEKMERGGQLSGRPIGRVGQYVFKALAQKAGAFVRPVPFDRDDLSVIVSCTERTVAKAMKRLIDQEMVTMSGPRSAPMALLHLPPHVIAAYERHAAKFVECLGDPAGPHELERALALLDEYAVDGEQTKH